MIDWFRGEIPFLHDPLPTGRILSLEADGSIAWESPKSLMCRSSHETSLKIKSAGGNGEGRANLPVSRAIDCAHCQGTGLFRPFPRPATVTKLSLRVAQGGCCPNCHEVQTVETYYPRNDPLTLVTRTVCRCSVEQIKQPFNPEAFYLTLYANNPNHPINQVNPSCP